MWANSKTYFENALGTDVRIFALLMYLATLGTMAAQIVIVRENYMDFEVDNGRNFRYIMNVPRFLPIVILCLTVATGIFAALDYAKNSRRTGWITAITVALGQPAYLLQILLISALVTGFSGSSCDFAPTRQDYNDCLTNNNTNYFDEQRQVMAIIFSVFALQSVSNAIQLGAIFNTGRFVVQNSRPVVVNNGGGKTLFPMMQSST